MDGAATKVSFGLPPTHVTSFLVGEPKNLPRVVRWHFSSVMASLISLAGVLVVSESTLVQNRNKEKYTEEWVGRCSKDSGHGREWHKRLLKMWSL
jgi:hypothetical protein